MHHHPIPETGAPERTAEIDIAGWSEDLSPRVRGGGILEDMTNIATNPLAMFLIARKVFWADTLKAQDNRVTCLKV
ncbi:hypothetical protein EOK75_06535 [Pseudorhodobacter turbinis]|uniref:Uncharacterized protein n=1 Tax=Pseudorhodobacter turbinis TaxID=2500533 RepID=A0A4P8EF22_9RHOB|nr:hypothetical protein EOK75_06535 [Pseudorhodobacter turbinis]